MPGTRLTVPPAAGAVVMGTGIVSVALSLDDRELLSRLLLAVAGAIWIGLVLLLAMRVRLERELPADEFASPAALSGVAGTAVLGTRVALLGWNGIAITLLVLAFCVWLALVPNVLRRWRTPTVGASFLLVVSTESLAALGALLSLRERADWLAVAALVALALGIAAYVLVLARFDLSQLRVGRGDHWVAGGALAIAALACGEVARAADGLSGLHRLGSALGVAAFALWLLAIGWLPALAVAEVIAPRLSYDARRWSTVFPVGMYAACSFTVGDLRARDVLPDFARVWIWVALGLWVVVFAAMLRRGLALRRT
jgi:tellurite resistance protein TehA-like permease